jgi:hypothetical protein
VVEMPQGAMISYHALIMVGWSWGKNFGDNGYLHIPLNYPITEGWVMKKGEINGEKKIEVQNWQIGKKNLFGANVTFAISSTIKCRVSLFVNDKRKGFTKQIQVGTTHIHFNIPFELNSETNIKLAFVESGSFFDHKIVGAWEGILKTETTIIAK